MKFLKLTFLLLLFPLLTGATAHKFYVSITKIEYIAESESIQVITQLFVDDIEQNLRKRYNKKVSLGTKKETEADALLLKEYILQKLNIKVNGNPVVLNYLGKEYENDLVKSYIEITGIKEFKEIEVENKILMDTFEEQQNIIHLKAKDQRRSLILDKDNPKGLLNFD